MSSNRTKVFRIIESVSKELSVEIPEVRFQNRKNLATVRKTNGRVVISFKYDIESFESEFLEMFIFYTLSKLNGKVDTEKFFRAKNYLSEQIETIEKNETPKLKTEELNNYNKKQTYIGAFWNLKDIYNKVFGEFRVIFEPVYGKNPPKLAWTQRPTYRVMAYYTFGENKVSISRSLDAPDTPEIVLKYLMFHELLHGVAGKGSKNRNLQTLRRGPHNRTFKSLESLFPEKERVEFLLKTIAKASEAKIKASKRSLKYSV